MQEEFHFKISSKIAHLRCSHQPKKEMYDLCRTVSSKVKNCNQLKTITAILSF